MSPTPYGAARNTDDEADGKTNQRSRLYGLPSFRQAYQGSKTLGIVHSIFAYTLVVDNRELVSTNDNPAMPKADEHMAVQATGSESPAPKSQQCMLLFPVHFGTDETPLARCTMQYPLILSADFLVFDPAHE